MNYGFYDVLQLLGSLALFLYGMKVMSDALMKLAGHQMRSILSKMTSNRIFGVFTGFLITSVIQSSSATTLMVVSFSNASLLTLVESISVIMGANIGTTITAWLISILGFKVSMSVIALPLIGLGFGLTFLKKKKIKFWGNFVVGFALLFIGLQYLKESMPNIDSNPEMLSFLTKYTNLGFTSVLLFLLVGTILTVVIQSSSATMALTLVMCAQGWIPFELAASMVLGENVGTTITANLAALIANYQAKRTALAHLIFNILGVVWLLILFYPFLDFISWLTLQIGGTSPTQSSLAIPFAISLFHTSFNITNTAALIGFIKPIANIVERIIPEKEPENLESQQPKFLNTEALHFPETAIKALQNESKHLYKRTLFEIVVHALNLRKKDVISSEKPKLIVKKSIDDLDTDVRALYHDKMKNIYGEIILFASKTQSEFELSPKQNETVTKIKVANRKMVEIVKIVKELGRNVTKYMNSDNAEIKKEYDKYRKEIIKVLRIIYLFRKESENEEYQLKLAALRKRAKENLYTDNRKIDFLIRNNYISVDMASSLVNDHDNYNTIISRLIEVAELLYGQNNFLKDNLDQ